MLLRDLSELIHCIFFVQEEYSRIDLTVVCADGTQTELPGRESLLCCRGNI